MQGRLTQGSEPNDHKLKRKNADGRVGARWLFGSHERHRPERYCWSPSCNLLQPSTPLRPLQHSLTYLQGISNALQCSLLRPSLGL